MKMIWAFAALGALAACSPPVPDSAAGVGFDNYDNARRLRDAQLTGNGAVLNAADPVASAALPPAQAISNEPLDATGLAARTQQILAQTGTAPAAVPGAPVQASPSNPEPTLLDHAAISDENDFSAVGERRSIQDDKLRRAQIQAQYQVISPTALPAREGGDSPNIVTYALETSNPVGQQIYRRINIAAKLRYERNCGKYGSPDMAQMEFLSRGGPQRDMMGLDPDGDGYACDWDPRPFRRARGN